MEYWPPPCFPSDYSDFNLSGYDANNHSEQLLINQSTQRELKSVIRKLRGRGNSLNPHSGCYPRVERFILDFFPYTRKQINTIEPFQFLRWECHIDATKCSTDCSFPKEKLSVDPTFKKQIGEILPGKHSLAMKPIENSKPLKIQDFILDMIIIQSKNEKPSPYSVAESSWVSKLQNDQELILQETLCDVGGEIMDFNHESKLEEISAFNVDKFYLEILTKEHVTKSVSKSFNFPTWKEPNIIPIPDNYYYVMEQELFDETFNKLELYLRKIDPNSKNVHLSKRQKKLKKKFFPVWHLDKEVLMSWEWNPFRKIEVEFNNILSNLEELNDNKEKLISFTMSECTYFWSSELCLLQNSSQEVIVHKLPPRNENKPTTPETTDKATTTRTENDSSSDNLTSNTEINTSLIPHKRSILDPDLLSLIISKKKKSHQDTTSSLPDNTSDSLSNILQHGLVKSRMELSRKSSVLPEEYVPEIHIALGNVHFPTSSKTSTPKTIILNSSKLLINHDIVTQLRDIQGVCIIEQKLGVNCDIILNATTCLVRISLEKFQQTSPEGSLHYSKELQQLVQYFQCCIVLIEYDRETAVADPDIFWRVQLCLSGGSFTLHFIANEANGMRPNDYAACYVLDYVNKLSQQVNTTALQPQGRQDYELVHSLTRNPLLTTALLAEYNLCQLLLAVDTSNPPKQLTPYHLASFRRLVHAEW